MIKKLALFSLFSLLLLKNGLAQKSNPVLTADSLATGNYKDVLNSFFQLALDKFTGPDKELKLTSTPFAVMARLDTNLLVDTSYLKYKTLRNINFSFSLKLDSSYKFNGFSSGIKYAIINKRDETVSREFVEMVLLDPSGKELTQLGVLMGGYISTLPTLAEKNRISLEVQAFSRGTKSFDQLEPTLQAAILQATKDSPLTPSLFKTLSINKKFNLNTTANEIYQRYKKEFNNKPLWTIGVSDTTYKDQFIFSNIVLNTEFLQGINHTSTKNDVELDLKAAFQFTDDTLKTGRDLKRMVFGFESAANIVLKTKTTGKSFFELKLGGSYYHNFGSLYAGEVRNKITLDGTIRVRVMKDIWIPVEIKYDPEEGNVFGFLKVKANFTALKGIASFLKQ